MHRRTFLTTAAGAAALSFPAVLRAQSKDPIRIGCPLPLTGPFAAIATDMKQGAELAADELNAKGGIMGRKVEVLFRDDQLKPAVGAQRTQELIEKEKLPVHRRRPRRPRADGHQRADQEVQGAVHLHEPVRRDQRQARHQPHHLPRGAQPDHHLARGRASG